MNKKYCAIPVVKTIIIQESCELDTKQCVYKGRSFSSSAQQRTEVHATVAKEIFGRADLLLSDILVNLTTASCRIDCR